MEEFDPAVEPVVAVGQTAPELAGGVQADARDDRDRASTLVRRDSSQRDGARGRGQRNMVGLGQPGPVGRFALAGKRRKRERLPIKTSDHAAGALRFFAIVTKVVGSYRWRRRAFSMEEIRDRHSVLRRKGPVRTRMQRSASCLPRMPVNRPDCSSRDRTCPVSDKSG
ncbi:hypothetical protein ACFYPC_30950 [Streptomyces sp. NPDC005808]|uniref:hypothetical protein n=1 Tax=Streptomyces sp. NPDC005808 TaxID=3364734 RepID=UPI0036C20E33